MKYWSVLALAIVVVLTALAILRSDWKDRSTVMVAVMVLGCLAIFSHVAFSFTYHDGYAATMQVLTILALISFPAVCVLGIVMLQTQTTTTPGAVIPTVPSASTTVNPPDMTAVPSTDETISLGSPSGPASAPSETIAMQPDIASSMAWLVVTNGPSEGKSIQLKEGANTIGRSLENDLR